MAEEHFAHGIDEPLHDDQTVMRHLLHTVKGLSPISLAPALDPLLDDTMQAALEQFQFE